MLYIHFYIMPPIHIVRTLVYFIYGRVWAAKYHVQDIFDATVAKRRTQCAQSLILFWPFQRLK